MTSRKTRTSQDFVSTINLLQIHIENGNRHGDNSYGKRQVNPTMVKIDLVLIMIVHPVRLPLFPPMPSRPRICCSPPYQARPYQKVGLDKNSASLMPSEVSLQSIPDMLVVLVPPTICSDALCRSRLYLTQTYGKPPTSTSKPPSTFVHDS
jgi:hypothetical protein